MGLSSLGVSEPEYGGKDMLRGRWPGTGWQSPDWVRGSLCRRLAAWGQGCRSIGRGPNLQVWEPRGGEERIHVGVWVVTAIRSFTFWGLDQIRRSIQGNGRRFSLLGRRRKRHKPSGVGLELVVSV